MVILFLLAISSIFMSGCATKVSVPEENVQVEPQEPVSEETEKEIQEVAEEEILEKEIEPEVKEPELEEPSLTFEQAIWQKRIDAAMADSYCPPVTKVEYPSSYYQGPLIDSHYHLPSLPDSSPMEEAGEYQSSWPACTDAQINDCDRECGTLNVAEEDLSPSQDACIIDCIARKKCVESKNEEPYLGMDIKMSEIACTLQHEGTTRNFAFFPFYSEEISPYALEIVKRTEEQYPDLFTPFTDMPNVPEEPEITAMKAGQMLEQTIVAYPGLFQGWGEISLYVHYDPRELGAGSYLPPDSLLFTEIYSVLKKHKMMVYFHPGEDMRDNFELVLKQNPDINFIVHGDQIKDDIDYLMGKYPNIYFTINNFYANQDLFVSYEDGTAKTKESFFAALKNYEPLIQKDLRTWKNLIEAHPDQVMWGLDRDEAVLWTFDRDVGLKLVDYGRAFIGRLDPTVQERFAYKNVEKLLQER